MSRPKQSKRWCFTLNNPGDVVPSSDGTRYLVYGREKASTGTPHLQGFVIFRTGKRLSQMRDWLPGAHFEEARGTSQQAASYCKKDGDATEVGVCPMDLADRNRSRWSKAIQSARAGTIEEDDPEIYVRYTGFCMREAARGLSLIALPDVCGLWIMGKSGVGKSHIVRWYGPLYDKQVSNWWCGYNYEPIVLIDDVTTDNAKYIASGLLRWCDKYPCSVQVKGGAMRIRPNLIVVTSNFDIDMCFAGCGVDLLALRRRFIVVKKESINDVNIYILVPTTALIWYVTLVLGVGDNDKMRGSVASAIATR